MTKPLSPLNYALLGLVHMEPRTGYALRMVFETTPMGNYSSSPGSIYPALKALERAGLIEGRAAGARKSLYHIQPEGLRVLNDWLAQPVAETENTDIALLRFAFLQSHPQPQLTLDFLTSFEAVMRRRADGLAAFLRGEVGSSMPLQSRLAVQHGLQVTQASADWAIEALAQLQISHREAGL
jgi:DNA-binding PadR family transcriptional regulator